uniref:Predicted gene, 54637 n=1 Tax=Mus musculus TaxID=10090 RepID=A0A075B5I0_MOUSE
SLTIIVSSVLRCQASELHVGCVGGCVYSKCGLAFELLIVGNTTIFRMNSSNPFQSLLQTLLHPLNFIVIKIVARSLAGQLHLSPRYYQLWSRLLKLDL